MRRLAWSFVPLLASCDCGHTVRGDDEPTCVDEDLDGCGVGCFCPDDCDDTNPKLAQDCSDCDERPLTPGCPCDGAVEETDCYTGPDGTEGVGTCRGGTQRCVEGFWGDCEGQVEPSDESCDGIDEDCDGTADDGLGDECGDCGPGCHETEFPGEDGWGVDDENSDGVEENEDGDLVLGSTSLRNDFVWVSNHYEGTVSKISSETGAEVGRYVSAIPTAGNGARPPLEYCNWSNTGNCPSRVTVALDGDVYVGNRAFGNQPTVTRIAGDLSRCEDMDGDGVVRTSTDLDGDDRISLAGDEFLDIDDECVLWTVPIGGANGLARAMAIDADGFVWVGNFNEHAAYKLDPEDGTLLATVNLPAECWPYGMALDSDGTVWVNCPHAATRGVTSIDPVAETAGAFVPYQQCTNGYGIAIDTSDRVWIGGWESGGVCRYDPGDGSWSRVALAGGGYAGGIASDGDDEVWQCVSRDAGGVPSARLVSIGTEALDITSDRDLGAGALGSHGCAVDALGNIWTANLEGDSVTRVDPAGGTIDTFPAGDGPYTYSDFTGFQLRDRVNPTGTYRRTIEGCLDGPTEWRTAVWDATTPPGTSVSLAVRVAATADGLAAAKWLEEWTETPADLAEPPGPVPEGRFLEFELRLRSEDEESSPAVHSLSFEWACIVG